MELCICLRCFALKRLIVRDEKIIFHEVCGLQTLHISVVSFVSSQNEEKKRGSLCLELFAVYSKLHYLHISQIFSINAY